MIVVDTTFLIDLLNADEGAVSFVQQEDELYTTQPNIFEILRGMFRVPNTKRKITEAISLLGQLYVLPLTDEGSIHSASISSDLTKKGTPVGDMDCLTAGIAQSNGFSIIVTRNVRHFERMKGILVREY